MFKKDLMFLFLLNLVILFKNSLLFEAFLKIIAFDLFSSPYLKILAVKLCARLYYDSQLLCWTLAPAQLLTFFAISPQPRCLNYTITGFKLVQINRLETFNGIFRAQAALN